MSSAPDINDEEILTFQAQDPKQQIHSLRTGYRIETGYPKAIRSLVRLARPRTCLVSVLSFALAYSNLGSEWTWKTSITAIICFLIPAAGNIHNALIDLEEDSLNLPGRLVLVAQVGFKKALSIVTIATWVMVALSLSVSGGVLILTSISIVGIRIYSGTPIRAKGHPFGGLLVFSGVVAIPFAMGIAVPTGTHGWLFFPTLQQHSWNVFIALFLFVGTLFIAKGMVKNLPDYAGDRAAGVRTSSSICQSQHSAAVISLLVTTAAYSFLLIPALLELIPPRALISLVWMVLAIHNAMRFLKHEDMATSNALLKFDMAISIAFFSTLLILCYPTKTNGWIVGTCLVVLIISDFMSIDSRRAVDTGEPMARHNTEVSSGR